MEKLDKYDWKILYELDLDSRQSFKNLGKKVGLSKETVFNRVKKLEENEIIDGYITTPDVHKLGFQNYRLFLKFKNTDKDIERKIIGFFINSRVTGWVIQVKGNWDLGIWFIINDLFLLKKVYEQFKNKFSNYVSDEKLSIFTDVIYYSKSYLLNQKNKFSLKIMLDSKSNYSEINFNILKILVENSRTPLIEIADKCKISTKTAIKKIKEMEKEKIILGYRLKINLEKIGIEYYKIHCKLNNISSEIMQSIEDFAFQNPNIIYMDKTISGYDLEFDVQVLERKDLDDLVDKIKETFKKNIENVDILIYSKEFKHVFLPKSN